MILQTNVRGVNVTVIGLANVTVDEIKGYVAITKTRVQGTLRSIEVIARPDSSVDIHWTTYDKFERIRRITGYLSGTLDAWNDSKRAEERDRVKHGLDGVDGA